MGMRKIIGAVLVAVFAAGTAIAANDSTSVEEVDVPWKAPSYATTAGSANYATNAGQLGGKTEGQLNVNSAASSTTAGSALSAGVAGTAGSATTATSATTSGYATTAGNGVAGVSGSNLNLSNGTSYSLPSGGGGGGSSCTTQGTFAGCLTYSYIGNANWIDTAGCVWSMSCFACNGGPCCTC